MSVSEWRIRRKILGIRQRDVADRARLSQARYSLLERGEATPSPKEIEEINRALELPENLRQELAMAIGSISQVKS